MDEVAPENEETLPLATIPQNLCVSLRGFSDDASARQFGEFLGGAVGYISRYINLERLDGSPLPLIMTKLSQALIAVSTLPGR